jgi:hypothetical protein
MGILEVSGLCGDSTTKKSVSDRPCGRFVFLLFPFPFRGAEMSTKGAIGGRERGRGSLLLDVYLTLLSFGAIRIVG